MEPIPLPPSLYVLAASPVKKGPKGRAEFAQINPLPDGPMVFTSWAAAAAEAYVLCRTLLAARARGRVSVTIEEHRATEPGGALYRVYRPYPGVWADL